MRQHRDVRREPGTGRRSIHVAGAQGTRAEWMEVDTPVELMTDPLDTREHVKDVSLKKENGKPAEHVGVGSRNIHGSSEELGYS